VTGSSGSFTGVQDFSQSANVPGGSYVVTGSITFTGSLSGGVVTGNIVEKTTVDIRVDGFPGVFSRASAQGTFAVTMR
jgi:hypothetical protein